jgi:hypothetical protein
MRRPADILSWLAATVAACAATVLLFGLFPPALIVAGAVVLVIGTRKRATRIGGLVIALGVVWFVLGFATSTLLLSTGTKTGGGAPVRVATPVAQS